MTHRACLGCQEEKPVDPTTEFCVDCLIKLAQKRLVENPRKSAVEVFDPKAAAARNDD